MLAYLLRKGLFPIRALYVGLLRFNISAFYTNAARDLISTLSMKMKQSMVENRRIYFVNIIRIIRRNLLRNRNLQYEQQI